MIKKVRSGTELERFMDSFTRIPFSGCWIWMRSVDGDGYGIHYYKGAKSFAHRRSLELLKGIDIGSLLVCHHCDTPSCINPDHLFIGTQKQNAQDALRKLRHYVGEKNGRAKLSQIDIQTIMTSSLNGSQLGAMLGVSRSSVNRIRKGVQWQHMHQGVICATT